MSDLASLGLQTDERLDLDFIRGAGLLKAIRRRVSLADCFAITLTQLLGATLVTTDHHELDAVAADGLCPILFIR